MTECHISSLVVHTLPDRVPGVVEGIGRIQGADIHGGADTGKLIVTLETDTESQVVERINAIQLLDGVLAATLLPSFRASSRAGITPWTSRAVPS